TGLSLAFVALTEKLWNPDLGRAFLLQRPELNVFQTLPGMSWFTDDTFVLAAGLAEAAIGAMLISGFSPRLVILAMWLPFNLGIPVLPSQELLGHLPILGIMYLLLVESPTLVPSSTASLRRVAPVLAPARPVHSIPHVNRTPVAAAKLDTLSAYRADDRNSEPELAGSRAHD